MFEKILIANRGEIACRIIKTARRLGIKSVCVYSDADSNSQAVLMADEAVAIGSAPASESYLVMDKILAAAKETGAQAIHPGYGFLSENPIFAEQVKSAGITWVGPNAEAILAMGDKITSKKFADEAGVNTVPGHMGLIETAEEAKAIAEQVGYPVMIKASAGGGGKGMRIAWNKQEVVEGFDAARAEARSSFGDERIFIEKFVTEPRHIEIQVLGDKYGNVIHLNERECSIQRRNQKIIEEAPSPFLDQATRDAMGAQAVALAKAVNYDSAGTVEFIVDKDRNFYFLEMNTRLQVEHPVTELITGLDLVEYMLRIADGEALQMTQGDVTISGWAFESRIYAEDPYRGFLPSIGRLKRYIPPQEGSIGESAIVRNDTGVDEGDEISIYYDPMIAKLVTHASDREEAIEAQLRALDQFYIEGIGHNIPFLSALIMQKRFRSGHITTNYIPEEFPDGFSGVDMDASNHHFIKCAITFMHALKARALPNSGNLKVAGQSAEWVVKIGSEYTFIHFSWDNDKAIIRIEDQCFVLASDWLPGNRIFKGRLNDTDFIVQTPNVHDGYRVLYRGVDVHAQVVSKKVAKLYELLPEREVPDTSKHILSPMPGLIVSMCVESGQQVKMGDTVCIIEAMKMQNIIRAESDGVVDAIHFTEGDSVAADEVLIMLA